MIEVKVNAPYDQKIVNIFQSLKKRDQQVTLSFDRHSVLGFENRNRVVLDANIKINEKNITYYSINLYKVAGKEILIYPFNYSKLLWSVTFFSLGLIPTDEEFEVIFELSVSKSERDTKNKVVKASSIIYVHNGINYSNSNFSDEFNRNGTLQAYEFIARYILN